MRERSRSCDGKALLNKVLSIVVTLAMVCDTVPVQGTAFAAGLASDPGGSTADVSQASPVDDGNAMPSDGTGSAGVGSRAIASPGGSGGAVGSDGTGNTLDVKGSVEVVEGDTVTDGKPVVVEEAAPRRVHVVFDVNGPREGEGAVTGEMGQFDLVMDGTAQALPRCSLVREGYEFRGWSTTADGKDVPDSPDTPDVNERFEARAVADGLETVDLGYDEIVRERVVENGVEVERERSVPRNLEYAVRDDTLRLYAQWAAVKVEPKPESSSQGELSGSSGETSGVTGSDAMAKDGGVAVDGSSGDKIDEKADVKADEGADSTSGEKTDVKSDVKSDDKSDVKSDDKTDVKSDDKTDDKSDDKSGSELGTSADDVSVSLSSSDSGVDALVVEGAVDATEDVVAGTLKSVSGVSGDVATRAARKLGSVSLRSAVPVDDLPRQLDGSNIEGVSARWVTVDTVDDGVDEHLYLKPAADERQSVMARFNYALSGEHDYQPGDVTITIPAEVFKYRDGTDAGKWTIPYPEEPKTTDDFMWSRIGDTYVFTNTRVMKAATKGYIEVMIGDLVPHKLVDMAETEPLWARVEVVTHLGNAIGLSSNEITAVVDTEERVTQADKWGSAANVKIVDASEVPAGARVGSEESYVVVSWSMNSVVRGNTEFSLDLFDRKSDQYVGKVMYPAVSGSGEYSCNKYNGWVGDGMLGYEYVQVAYPLSQFEPDVVYTFENDVIYTLTESDPAVGSDPQLITTATDHATIPWSWHEPKFYDPTGHFMVQKNGNDGADGVNSGPYYTHRYYNIPDTNVENDSGWRGVYPGALNEICDGNDVEIAYTVQSIGYLLPWTLDGDPRVVSNFGRRNVRMVTYDGDDTAASMVRLYDGRSLALGTDYEYKAVEFPVIPKIYKANAVNLNPDGSFVAMQAGDGTVNYVYDYDSAHVPEVTLEAKVGGIWQQVCVASWRSGSLVITGGLSVGNRVMLPADTEQIRTSVDTNIAGIKYYVRPILSLKADGLMGEVAESLFAQSNLPSVEVQNSTYMKAYDSVGDTICDIHKWGYDDLRGYSTDVGVWPSKEATQKSFDVDHRQVVMHYDVKVEEKSLIPDRITYDQAVADGKFVPDTRGVFYDLLPKGMYPLTGTVRLRDGDSVEDVRTYEDWRGSGRTMLVVKAVLSPVLSEYNDGGVRRYEDMLRLQFDATYSFESLHDYGRTTHNVVAYESLSRNPLGTIEHYGAEADDPYSDNNSATATAFENDAERDLMRGLDSDRTGTRFVYAGAYGVINVPSAGRTSLSKDVQVNDDGRWSYGTHGDDRTVFEGGRYQYRLRMMSDADTDSKDLVLYDSLENFRAGQGNDPVDVNAPWWRGELVSVDVSQMVDKGAAPVVYYSVVDNLQMADETDPRRANATNTNLADSNIWVRADDYHGDMSAIHAIAIDCSKAVGGGDFVLGPMESVVALVNMHAPSGTAARNYIAQKGAWGDSAMAYNNAYMTCTSIDHATGIGDSDNFVRHDYTKVGLKEFGFRVRKVWDDDDDRDGVRPQSVTFHLIANDVDTGLTSVLTGPAWEGGFDNIPYTDQDGRKIQYSVTEDVPGSYVGTVVRDGLEIVATNRHDIETVDVRGEKTWVGGAEHVPSYVLVRVLADGVVVRSQRVFVDAEGRWRYSFDDLPKYRDHGTEIVYTVDEFGVDVAWIPTVTGHDIRNVWHPFGDLVVTKAASGQTDGFLGRRFPIRINLTNALGFPLEGVFVYETSDGRTGTLVTGSAVELAGGESVTVRELPMDARYVVLEDEAAGYLTTVFGGAGTIVANGVEHVRVRNEYAAEGLVNLEARKHLTGRELGRYQFRAEVLDENGALLRSIANKADGTFTFGAIRYTEKDVGEHVYTIRETQSGRSGYTYDESEYEAHVMVTDNGNGTLGVSVTYVDGQGHTVEYPTFENAYHASGSIRLKAWKQLVGRDLQNGEFSFSLADEGGTVLQTKTNDADGEILFDPIQFDEGDVGKTFHYVATEVTGSDSTVDYSEESHEYVVTVYDNGDGTLSFSQGLMGTVQKGRGVIAVLGANEWSALQADLRAGSDMNPYYVLGSNSVISFHDGMRYEDLSLPFEASDFADDASHFLYDVSSVTEWVNCVNNTYTESCKQYGTLEDVCARASNSRYATVLRFSDAGKAKLLELFPKPYATLNLDKDELILLPDSNPDSGIYMGYYFNTSLAYGVEMVDVPGVTSDVPLFTNTLQPGSLQVEKHVDTVPAGHEGDLFDFHVRLDGDNLPETLSYTLEPMGGFAVLGDPEGLPSFGDVVDWVVDGVGNLFAPREAYAADDTVWWGYEDGTLYLSGSQTSHCTGSVQLSSVSWSGSLPWYSSRDGITTVVIDGPFAPTSTAFLFYGCKNLTTFVNWSNLDVSNVTSMSNMFYGCSNAAFNPDVSNWDVSNVTNMDSLFRSCYGTAFNPDVSCWNTSNVTNMHGMFESCSGDVFNPDVSGWDTSKVTQMDWMFQGCRGAFFNPDVSGWDVSRVTTLGYMFYGCSGASFGPDVSSWNMSNVTDMSWLFTSCSGVGFTRLDVSGWDVSNVTDAAKYPSIGGCTSLRELVVSSGTRLATSVPSHSAQGVYTAAWRNDDLGVTGYTGDNVVSSINSGQGAGTWEWDRIPCTKLVFDANGGSGVMASQLIAGGTSAPISANSFSLFDRSFAGWNTEADGSGTSYDDGASFAAPSGEQTVTLYAQWRQADHVVTLEDGAFDISIPANWRVRFDGFPAGIPYSVYEDSSDGWVLVSQSGTSGNVVPAQVSTASFTNRYDEGHATANIMATKLLDGRGAESGAFSFELREGDTVIERVTNSAGGVVTFSPITYGEGDVGNHVYTIEEVVVDSDTVSYDLHRETVTVRVMKRGGNVGATVAYDADGAVFENESVPGALQITKQTSGGGDPDEEFEFEVTLKGVGDTFGREPEVPFVPTTQYSHTPNIADDGTQAGSYANNLATKDVVTIPGAERLHVSLTYGTENNWDMVYVFQGEYTGSVTRNMSVGQLAKYMGGGNTTTTVEFDVEGDTVTFAFYSDGGTQYYGYYAVVTDDPSLMNVGGMAVPGMLSNVVDSLSGLLSPSVAYADDGSLGETDGGIGGFLSGVWDGLVSLVSPREAYAADDTVWWGYSNGTLYLSGSQTSHCTSSRSLSNISWYSYVPWYRNRTSITKVVIDGPFAPTRMDYWFYDCSKLNTFENWSRLDVSNVTSMYYTFYGCSNASFNPDVSNWNTSNVTDMSWMFYGCCGAIFNPNVSNWVTSNVTDMSYMFYKCYGDAFNPDMSHWDVSHVIRMTNMFYECYGGAFNPDVSAWDVSNVKEMIRTFGRCRGNSFNPDVSRWDTANVTDMGGLFYQCSGAALNPDVSGWDISKVTNIDSIFNGCSGAAFNPDVSRWNTSNVTSMGYAFSGCNGAAFTTPDVSRWDTSNVKYMGGMFRDCSGAMFNPDVSRWNTSNVTGMGYMFYNCSGAWFNPDVSHWNTSSVTGMDYMFYSCSGTAFNPDVSSWDTSSVTSMSYMFYYCSGTAFNPDVSNWDTSNVISMNYMFSNCVSPTFTVDVSNWDTSSVENMSFMFAGCYGSVFDPDVSGWNTSNVTNMNGTFLGCSGASFSPDVSHWSTTNVTNMGGMFYGCSGESFTSVDLSGWDVGHVSVVQSMFGECSSLRTIYAHSNADWGALSQISSSGDMFVGCVRLRGGSGTVYDSQHVDKAYARVDGLGNSPGYFTARGEALVRHYAILDSDGTLTFFDVLGDLSTGVVQTVIDVDGTTRTGEVFHVNSQRYSYSNPSPWQSRNKSIKSVRFAQMMSPKSMHYWFYGCSNLEDFDVTNLDFSQLTDVSYMFQGCSGSSFNPDVSNWDTSNITDMSALFAGCRGASFNPDVSDWDTSNVTNMSGLFAGCSGATFNPDLSAWNTSSVTDMSSMFEECSGAAFNPDVSDWDTSSVLSMEMLFARCSGAAFDPDVSNWDTSSVLWMDELFSECSGAAFSPDVSNWDTSNVRNMGSIFYYCRGASFTEIDVSKWVFSGNAELDLRGCDNLKRIVVSGDTQLRSVPWPYDPNGVYLDTWKNEDIGVSGATGDDVVSLVNAGNGAGTWEWEVSSNVAIVRFDANGGTLVGSTGTVTQTGSVTPVIVPGVTYGAKYLVGWNTKRDGSGTAYEPGDTVTPVLGDEIILYALWSDTPPQSTYHVTIRQESVRDLGTYVTSGTEDRRGPRGETITVTPDSISGFIAPEAQVVTLADNDSDDVTFDYARVRSTVTLDGNDYVDDATMEFVYGIRQKLPMPGKVEGKRFVAWSENADGTGMSYGAGTPVMFDTDTTLYAQYADAGDVPEVQGLDSVVHVKVKAGKTITIPNIPAGTAYAVCEVNVPSGWTEVSLENAEGRIGANEVVTAVSSNRYEAVPGSFSILGHKLLRSDDEIREGQFAFQLLDQSDHVVATVTNGPADVHETVPNDDGVPVPNPYFGYGTFRFDDIPVNAPGTYTYHVREVVGSEPGVIYDEHVESVIVTVTDDLSGHLQCAVTYDGDGCTFVNDSEIIVPSGNGSLTLSKVALDGTPACEGTEFSFDVAMTIPGGIPLSGEFEAEGVDGDSVTFVNGHVTVPLEGGESVTIRGLPTGSTYEVSEDAAPGWVMEGSTGMVGELSLGEAAAVSVTNRYVPDGSFSVSGTKVGIGVEPGGFTFELVDDGGNFVARATSGADGSFSFANLPIEPSWAGTTRTYHVNEANSGETDVLYDTHVDDVSVVFSDDGAGHLSAVVTPDGDGVTFTNRRLVSIPGTGLGGIPVDMLVCGIGLVVVGSSVAIVRVRRRRED